MSFNHNRARLRHKYLSAHPNPFTQCTCCFHSSQHTDDTPSLWPRYFCPSCPSCLPTTPPIQPNPHTQFFTCTAIPTSTRSWLVHRTIPLPYQPSLNAHAAPGGNGANRHTTNIEHLCKIAGEISTIELNIELGYRNVELGRAVWEMDAQLRGIEDCGMLDMVAMEAQGPPFRGFVWL